MRNKQLERIELGVSTSAFLKAGESGLLVLPERVADALAAVDRATEALQNHVSVDLEAARERYAEQTAEALRKDAPLPSAKAVEQVAGMARQHEEVRRALTTAEMQLFTELRSVIPSADELVTEHVRPVLLSTYDQARKLLERHGPVLGEPADAAITGPPALASAWSTFGQLVSRISGLRDLHHRLTAPSLTKDTTGSFATWTEPPNDDRLWARSPVRLAEKWRPWPSEPRPFTAWLVHSGLTVWVPTAEEQDARHADVFDAPSPNPNALLTAAGF